MGGAGAGRLGASARKMLGCSPAAARCTVLRARRNSRREGRARARGGIRGAWRCAQGGRRRRRGEGQTSARSEIAGVTAGSADAPARPLPPDAADAAGGVHRIRGAADAPPRPSDAPCGVRGGGTPGDAWAAAAGAARAGSLSIAALRAAAAAATWAGSLLSGSRCFFYSFVGSPGRVLQASVLGSRFKMECRPSRPETFDTAKHCLYCMAVYSY